jgi:hypothetical protein
VFEPLDEAAYYRWIIMRRYTEAGILRPTAEAAVWSACDGAPKRKLVLAQLVEAGLLTQLRIGELAGSYYAQTSALVLLDEPPSSPRMIFMERLTACCGIVNLSYRFLILTTSGKSTNPQNNVNGSTLYFPSSTVIVL